MISRWTELLSRQPLDAVNKMIETTPSIIPSHIRNVPLPCMNCKLSFIGFEILFAGRRGLATRYRERQSTSRLNIVITRIISTRSGSGLLSRGLVAFLIPEEKAFDGLAYPLLFGVLCSCSQCFLVMSTPTYGSMVSADPRSIRQESLRHSEIPLPQLWNGSGRVCRVHRKLEQQPFSFSCHARDIPTHRKGYDRHRRTEATQETSNWSHRSQPAIGILVQGAPQCNFGSPPT